MPKLKPKSRAPSRQRQRMFKSFIPVLKVYAIEEGAVMAETMAKDIAHEAKTALREQKFRWKELTPRYLRWKEKQGLDLRMLIATKEYLNKIGAWKDSLGRWFAGVRPNAIHIASGLPLWLLARIHEFGSRKMHIPMRQLWRPVISIIKRRRAKYKQAYYLNVRRKLRRAGYKL